MGITIGIAVIFLAAVTTLVIVFRRRHRSRNEQSCAEGLIAPKGDTTPQPGLSVDGDRRPLHLDAESPDCTQHSDCMESAETTDVREAAALNDVSAQDDSNSTAIEASNSTILNRQAGTRRAGPPQFDTHTCSSSGHEDRTSSSCETPLPAYSPPHTARQATWILVPTDVIQVAMSMEDMARAREPISSRQNFISGAGDISPATGSTSLPPYPSTPAPPAPESFTRHPHVPDNKHSS